ncbi:MAG: DUF167 domain-containing protein [Deltaproteobacteria bacterium]|jgi:uncharacterized protein (TIGR00251 family)|nr:DUF167 domain-containing protein [Deltaproteobacteria bacterium]
MASAPPSESCRLRVRVSPGASGDRVTGMKGDEIAVSVTAPPVDGRANASLVKFLAASLGLKSRDVTVTAGLSSRSKTVRVEGICEAEARAKLLGTQANEIGCASSSTSALGGKDTGKICGPGQPFLHGSNGTCGKGDKGQGNKGRRKGGGRKR